MAVGIRVIILAILCAILSIIFCMSMQTTSKIFKTIFKNQYIRIFVGGAIIAILTFILKSTDYNGAGMGIIENAIHGTARPEAFILKLIFTCITIGCGFRGGEIVPSFFIGATFGCTAGALMGLDPGFGAAIGLICFFCGVVNCPLTSLILSIELFGASGILFFAIGCSVSYMLSGYYSLYSEQKIIYSKLRPHYVNLYTNNTVKTGEKQQ
jgi:H+/Cl- antiporter ClcA